MKERLETKFQLFLLLCISFVIPYFGTAQDKNQKNDSVEPKISALSLVQIPEFGKKTRKLIDNIQVKITEDENLDEISLGIKDVIVTLDNKHKELNDTLKIFQLDRLDKESRELSLINQRVTE